ncbi:stage II sporulation protein M|uniref:Uncharacterized membrane protein SpoIIM, required for sporulation n=1 Tax=Dendrosporobacter quercicolus TaxID=146817 RepID=A0A1G9UQG1_9FIRM|nr:stage II sporulation protein M [Dendrosporobacter quercicolus]NSL48063.1 stage II sporulation protein M [Dendrosporobacter quercicolus DSM 1736]SDM62168.1 Uncharacterized membrane protein SpoIIM, required for sporulation [Dendrosporobacter quercicolus]
MNSELFLKTYRQTWERFDRIVQQMERSGIASLSREEVRMLGPLFRRITAQLAYARSNYPGHEMVGYLNNLVVKAHGHLYRQETFGLKSVLHFYSREFPRRIADERRLIGAAAAILLLGLLTGYLIYYFQPVLTGWFIPEQLVPEEIVAGQTGINGWEGLGSLLSTVIMLNNIKVGVLAFGLGVTWGLGTCAVLYLNGIMVGILGAMYTNKGYALDFWSLILPHGVLELAAIFICGGAGFVLAKALVKPGDFKRRELLPVQGRAALSLVAGTLPLFVIAGLIEGFVTPSVLPKYVKVAVGGGSLLLFLYYVWRGNQAGQADSYRGWRQ